MKKLYGFISRLQLLCNGVRDTSEFMASFQIGFANQTNYTSRRKKDVLFGVYNMWAPAKSSDILEQSHQDIDTWYYHETLRNDRGDTKKKDDFWNTCLPDFITHVKSSGMMRDT